MNLEKGTARSGFEEEKKAGKTWLGGRGLFTLRGVIEHPTRGKKRYKRKYD